MSSMLQKNRARQAFIAFALVTTMFALGATYSCAYNPVKDAQTSEQKAYALYGEFVIYEEQAAKLLQSPEVPANVKATLRDADAKAKPLADRLLAAALEVVKVQIAVKAGADTPERLAIVQDNLAQWYESASPKILDLVHAVKGD